MIISKTSTTTAPSQQEGPGFDVLGHCSVLLSWALVCARASFLCKDPQCTVKTCRTDGFPPHGMHPGTSPGTQPPRGAAGVAASAPSCPGRKESRVGQKQNQGMRMCVLLPPCTRVCARATLVILQNGVFSYTANLWI